MGTCPTFVEPFFGSGAVLLGRPSDHTGHIETVNDLDGYVANFFRAVKSDPEETAHWADNPIFESELHSRHSWLVQRKDSLVAKLEGDPDYYDAKVAGWWAWGMSCWIGGSFCSGVGPWVVEDGQLVKRTDTDMGITRRLPSIGSLRGVRRIRPQLRFNVGTTKNVDLLAWFHALADRFSRVRVCCGDWSRICGHSPTVAIGLTGVFLDPPYSTDERDIGIYSTDLPGVARDVRDWAVEAGKSPLMRIALCGYDTEHEMPQDWATYHWQAQGGYGHLGTGRGKANRSRETIWFSPACLVPSRITTQLSFEL